MRSVDVVICSKDRFNMLCDVIQQAKNLVPANQIIVVESSEHPNVEALKDMGVQLVLTPNVRLGEARRRGMEASRADLVLYVDDDLVLEADAYKWMLNRLDDERVAAVSGRVVYGRGTDPVLYKLYRHGRPVRQGGSGGFALMRRQTVLDVGGYNPEVHWGEDMELMTRLERNGARWVRELKAVAYHPLTLRESLHRGWRNGSGFTVMWRYAGKPLHKIVAQLVGRTFLMPIYYALHLLEPRIIVYYFLFNIVHLVAFLHTLNEYARENH